MRISARLLSGIVLFFIVLFSVGPVVVRAQTQDSGSGVENSASQLLSTPQESTPATPPEDYYATAPDVPNTLHNNTQSVMIEVMSAAICQLVGIDPSNPDGKCLGVDQTTGQIGFVEGGGGAIGVMDHMIATMFTTMPASTGVYFNYLADNFGVTKPTYAAEGDCNVPGIGFCGLTPFISLWTAFRNIVYLLFVIIFLLIGVAIMFRVKINPQTVMTVQNQIPKIIVGIILVTFSFAIAGLLIDIMYVSIYLLYNVLADVAKTIDGTFITTLDPHNLQHRSAIDGAAMIFANGTDQTGQVGIFHVSHQISWQIKELIAGILNIDQNIGALFNPLGVVGSIANLFGPDPSIANVLIDFLSLAGGLAMGTHVSALTDYIPFLPENVVGGTVTAYASYIGIQTLLRHDIPYLIPFLIITIAIFIALFRLWFTLLISYLNLLIDVVFAPFWIMGGLLPESKITAGAWIRDMLANLSVFPATIVMFLLAKIFISVFQNESDSIFVPPLIGNPAMQSTLNQNPAGGGEGSILGALVGLGFILMTPSVLTMMKGMFKAPGINLGPVLAPVSSSIGLMKGVGGRMRNIQKETNEIIITKVTGTGANQRIEYGRKGPFEAITGLRGGKDR